MYEVPSVRCVPRRLPNFFSINGSSAQDVDFGSDGYLRTGGFVTERAMRGGYGGDKPGKFEKMKARKRARIYRPLKPPSFTATPADTSHTTPSTDNHR